MNLPDDLHQPGLVLREQREVLRQVEQYFLTNNVLTSIDIVGVGDDLALARQAAIYKATHKMAYADCFAAALAKLKNAELLTGDPEFKAVEREIKMNWLK